MSNGVYKATQATDINLPIAYTWKRIWNSPIANKISNIYDEPKKRGRKPLFTKEHKYFLKELVLWDPIVI